MTTGLLAAQEVAEMPLLPSLVSPEELRDALGSERVRVFDATVFLRRAEEGGPYTVESGRECYARAHIPGAGFADIPGALSDPASPFPFTLPAAEYFAPHPPSLPPASAAAVSARISRSSPTVAAASPRRLTSLPSR